MFKWLVACELFGARISQDIAARTFAELDKAGMLTPRKLAGADWQRLVDLLGQGGYGRYDESTARELIAVGQRMVDGYGGSISRLRRDACSTKEIRDRLGEFPPGSVPPLVKIFLRDMAEAWRV